MEDTDEIPRAFRVYYDARPHEYRPGGPYRVRADDYMMIFSVRGRRIERPRPRSSSINASAISTKNADTDKEKRPHPAPLKSADALRVMLATAAARREGHTRARDTTIDDFDISTVPMLITAHADYASFSARPISRLIMYAEMQVCLFILTGTRHRNAQDAARAASRRYYMLLSLLIYVDMPAVGHYA